MKKTRISFFSAIILILTVLAVATACAADCVHVYEEGVCTECGAADPGYTPPCEHDFDNGACTECGAPCSHSYTNGACTVCGKADPDYTPPCTHNFKDGACTKCQAPCTHAYEMGECTVCGLKCIHAYYNGACVYCDFPCTHFYDDGSCVKCDAPCPHDYEGGICKVCGAECSHIYENSVCTVCGEACSHVFEGVECTKCGSVCSHSYEDGACSACGDPCSHSFDDGACTVCGAPCPHVYLMGECRLCGNVCTHAAYEGGFCTECGSVCPHTYVDGVCSKCNTPCSHRYVDGFCTKCGGAECVHDFDNGECTLCGAPCPHAYVNSECTVCGAKCTVHAYNNGACVVCGAPCYHFYDNSVCVKCGMPCHHSFEDGICTKCEATKPDYVPDDGGVSIYSEIVRDFRDLILYKYVNEELPPREEGEPPYTDALYEVVGYFDPANNDFGYAYRDIDSDGYQELLLVQSANRIYAIFTVKDGEPALVTTFSQGMGYLTEDNMVFYNTKEFSGGMQVSVGYHYKHLINGELVGISYGRDNPDENTEIYYMIPSGGERTEITKAEFNSIKKAYVYYWERPTLITKLCGLKCTSALVDTKPVSNTVADFSSYDAIIRTFAVMHNEVTGELTNGRCVRIKWYAGVYDTGMVFKSDADFFLYNKLFAACTLGFCEESADFGFAKSDLNGDGTEELILLDGEYNLVAIFTTVDGKAVLLDSYNDRRQAFIDADGLIHVSERQIPGGENDYHYYVYEIKDGKLSVREAIGIIDDTASGTVTTYSITDGQKTNMEKAEWDAAYTEITLGMTEEFFAAYTKENAPLTFEEAVSE